MRRVTAVLAGLIVVVLCAGVTAAVRHEPERVTVPDRETTPDGRRELGALRRDPILRFRARGARLERTGEEAAVRDGATVDMPTRVYQLFALHGEPGDAVDAYRARAEAIGWRLVETTCSFAFRSTKVVLTRQVDEWRATLELRAQLERPPPDGARRRLVVRITGEAPEREHPEIVPARRTDVHCLRNLDPADPSLVPPARVPTTSAEVCGLLTVAEAARAVPGIRTTRPTAGSAGCNYDRTELDGFTVFAAGDPRAVFEDARSVLDRGDARYVLYDQGTETGAGVWVDTRVGPVRVYTVDSSPRIDPSQLVALAELLARGR